MDDLGHPVWDADNHYYEALDAFTRHLDPGARSPHGAVGHDRRPAVPRARRQGEPGGHQRHLRPDLEAGLPERVLPRQPEPGEPARAHPRPRADPSRVPRSRRPPARARRAGPGRLLPLPDARDDLRGAAARTTPRRCASPSAPSTAGSPRTGPSTTRAASSPAPYLTLADVDWAVEELEWALDQGARMIVMRPAAPTTDTGRHSPFDARFDPFWARVDEAGITVVVHAGDSGQSSQRLRRRRLRRQLPRRWLRPEHQELPHRGGDPRLPPRR